MNKLIKIFFRWIEELLNVTPESIQQRFFVFLSRGVVQGLQMSQVIRNHPEILFASDPQKMDYALESLADFFPADDVKVNK